MGASVCSFGRRIEHFRDSLPACESPGCVCEVLIAGAHFATLGKLGRNGGVLVSEFRTKKRFCRYPEVGMVVVAERGGTRGQKRNAARSMMSELDGNRHPSLCKTVICDRLQRERKLDERRAKKSVTACWRQVAADQMQNNGRSTAARNVFANVCALSCVFRATNAHNSTITHTSADAPWQRNWCWIVGRGTVRFNM